MKTLALVVMLGVVGCGSRDPLRTFQLAQIKRLSVPTPCIAETLPVTCYTDNNKIDLFEIPSQYSKLIIEVHP